MPPACLTAVRRSVFLQPRGGSDESTQHAARSTQHAARTVAIATMGLGLLASCSQELDEPAATLGNTQQGIANGLDDVDTPLTNATFFVQTSTGKCSGSLITSTLGLTAIHCKAQKGDTVSFGVNNPASQFPLPSRTTRTVTAVFNHVPPSQVPVNATVSQRARDVSIIRLSAPVTMDASPVKPSFIRPTFSLPPNVPPDAGVGLAARM